MLLGSIEAGGTKFVCAVGNEDYRIMDSTKFPTTTPAETLQKCIDYFKQFNDWPNRDSAQLAKVRLHYQHAQTRLG